MFHKDDQFSKKNFDFYILSYHLYSLSHIFIEFDENIWRLLSIFINFETFPFVYLITHSLDSNIPLNIEKPVINFPQHYSLHHVRSLQKNSTYTYAHAY